MDETNFAAALFPLADKLRDLREEKDAQNAILKDINAEIADVERKLTDAMAEAECNNFTRKGKQYVMTCTKRWSAEADRKDELYAVLKAKGYEHLFTVNSQTLGSFIKEQVNETLNDEGETHVPDWLMGLVKAYEDIGVKMNSARK